MGRSLDFIRGIAPDFARSLYYGSRVVLRSARRYLTKVVTCDVRGVAIKIGVSSELEQYRADTYCTKEPETLDWLERNLKDTDTFFDIGANIGLYSLFAAKIKPQCTIYAFEPAAPNYSSLCKNIILNDVSNIMPCNFPVSNREAFDVFFVGDMQPGSALHSFGEASDFWEDSDAVALKQGTLSVTLDALVEEYGLPQPALLKIDVDGIEEKILDGAGTVLKSEKLRTILVELSFKDRSDIIKVEEKLARFGYKLWRKSDRVWESNGLMSQNYIFQRQ